MPRLLSFSIFDRRSEKQASRDADQCALDNGSISRAELRAQNGVFSGLDLAGASIRRRG
jgi:hypothetical protein